MGTAKNRLNRILLKMIFDLIQGLKRISGKITCNTAHLVYHVPVSFCPRTVPNLLYKYSLHFSQFSSLFVHTFVHITLIEAQKDGQVYYLLHANPSPQLCSCLRRPSWLFVHCQSQDHNRTRGTYFSSFMYYKTVQNTPLSISVYIYTYIKKNPMCLVIN